MKTVILRTHKPTKSNSFSDADRGTICLVSQQRNRQNRVNRLKTNEYLTVKFKQSILFAPKSVASFISGAYLVHNKKMDIHIIDSNSVMKKYLIQQTK
jgi:hypothetical protein